MCHYVISVIAIILSLVVISIFMMSRPVPLTTAITTSLMDNHLMIAASLHVRKNMPVVVFTSDVPDDLEVRMTTINNLKYTNYTITYKHSPKNKLNYMLSLSINPSILDPNRFKSNSDRAQAYMNLARASGMYDSIERIVDDVRTRDHARVKLALTGNATLPTNMLLDKLLYALAQ